METSTRRILILLSIIAAIGLITLYSASYIMTYRYPYPPPDYYLMHQIVSMIIGVVLMIILSLFDYRKHESYTGFYYILTLLALIAVFFSSRVAGSHRWIEIGSYSVQSSEFAKIFLLIYLASYVFRQNGNISTFKKGIFDPIVRLLPIYVLIFLEPDLGEEFGLIGIILILLLYYMLIREIVHIAIKVNDIFAKVYVTGFAFLIGIQILFNAGVSLGILPVTGITLPFFSYGGSSIISLLAGLGVVINIAYTNRD